MIWESYPWKEQLLMDADVVERWANKQSVTERRSFIIERKIFLSAYSIRKLLEAQKLSTEFSHRIIDCCAHPAISDRINHINNHRIPELYDLSRKNKTALRVMHLLNLIIHSFIFSEILDEAERIDGFHVTSDRYRYKCIWAISIATLLSLMRDVGSDYPSTAVRYWNRHKNNWEIWQGNGEPPADFLRKLKANSAVYRET
jgi:hypothetical protein